jgi:hypothetical protein
MHRVWIFHTKQGMIVSAGKRYYKRVGVWIIGNELDLAGKTAEGCEYCSWVLVFNNLLFQCNFFVGIIEF